MYLIVLLRVGAKRASPVKYAVGVFSVNTLFTLCLEIFASRMIAHLDTRVVFLALKVQRNLA